MRKIITTLGVLYLDDASKAEESKNLFKKAIELNPKHFESYNNLVLAISATRQRNC